MVDTIRCPDGQSLSTAEALKLWEVEFEPFLNAGFDVLDFSPGITIYDRESGESQNLSISMARKLAKAFK